MRRSIILTLFLIVLAVATNAQETFSISRPGLQFLNGILTISYDITGCRTGDKIGIKLIVVTSKGDTLRPSSVSGDVGNNVPCGSGKTIRWDVIKDNVNINDDLDIQLRGEKPDEKLPLHSPSAFKTPGRGAVILSSALVPGLGQKKLSGKSCYFLFSGLAYGAGAASLYYNLNSARMKNDYLEATGTERDDLYTKWEKSYNMSKYLAMGAAGTWLVNVIWTASMPGRKNITDRMKVSVTSTDNREFLVSAKLTF